HDSRVNDLAVALIHNHPTGFASFSGQDDRNERDLVALIQKRNGSASILASVVMLPSGALFGRIWRSPKRADPIDLIMVTGRRFTLHYPNRGHGKSPEFLSRQALALGPAFNQD